jgi:hypothetical protein
MIEHMFLSNIAGRWQLQWLVTEAHVYATCSLAQPPLWHLCDSAQTSSCGSPPSTISHQPGSDDIRSWLLRHTTNNLPSASVTMLVSSALLCPNWCRMWSATPPQDPGWPAPQPPEGGTQAGLLSVHIALQPLDKRAGRHSGTTQ